MRSVSDTSKQQHNSALNAPGHIHGRPNVCCPPLAAVQHIVQLWQVAAVRSGKKRSRPDHCSLTSTPALVATTTDVSCACVPRGAWRNSRSGAEPQA